MVTDDMGGVHAALATPIDVEGEIDHAGLRRLLDSIGAAGVSTVCPTGSTGEGPRLTLEQRRTVLGTVRDHAGDLRAVPAPAGGTPSDVLAELHGFADLGAEAALVPTPSYFPMTDSDVRRYYDLIAEASPLPVMLYNIPMMTGVRLAPDLVGEFASHRNVVGIKDSSRDFEYFQSVLAATEGSKDFAVLTGTDTMLFASLVVGGHGTIAASVNVAPGLSLGIDAAVRESDWTRAMTLQRQVQDLVAVCRTGSPPAGWKAALEHVGICSRRLVAPGIGLDDEEFDRLSTDLAALGLGQGA
ncbi:dihydrodipicolinate synthase family protein [Nocardioidaceae bacterium SCSIO 66511]|nr:dihydrodipicolinate synthase family protein [Nocardioidaceae bacterium SCSIO 66511]